MFGPGTETVHQWSVAHTVILNSVHLFPYTHSSYLSVCLFVECISQEPFILSASHLVCVLLGAQGSALWKLV